MSTTTNPTRQPATHNNGTPRGSRGRRMARAVVLAIAFLASALGSQAAFAAVTSGQGMTTQAAPASAGVTTHYYYPANSSCLWAYNVANGAVTAKWPTDLCRQLDPHAGAGMYDYYRNEAGPSAWFMKMGISNGYIYYTDALNWENTNYYVWYRYPQSNPSQVQIAVTWKEASTPGPYENLGSYMRAHSGYWLTFAINDARDRGILTYVMGLAYQAAPQTQPAQQEAEQNGTANQANLTYFQQLEQFEQAQATQEQHQAALQEYYMVLNNEANDEVRMAAPICDEGDIYSSC